MYNLEDATETILVPGERPNWSPDSKQLVYFSIERESKTPEIFVVNIDTKKTIKIAEGYNPKWSPYLPE